MRAVTLQILIIIGLLGAAPAVLSWPFADYVIAYQPGPGQWVTNPQFNDPARALGRPYGNTVTIPDNSSLVTLGDGGSITLGFDRPVWDDPRNPHGLDFIVFGNATWVGGDPAYRWQEPAFVEISMDANGNGIADDEWFLLLPNKLPADLVGSPATNPDTGHSRTILRQYAEYTPTLGLPEGKSPEEFYTVPDRWSVEGDPSSLQIDPGSGGGDAFDIALAVKQSSPGVPVRPIQYAGIPYFHFIRITDAVAGDSAGILGEISAEIDAVADVSPVSGGTTIGESKSAAVGTIVSLAEKVVSAVFPGEIYVQEEDRSSGIRVLTSDAAELGDRVDVIGLLASEDGEAFLNSASVYVKHSGTPPRPLGTPISRKEASGLSLEGLLIKTWGRVRSTSQSSFTLGEDVTVEVICGELPLPDKGDLVIVSGVCQRINRNPTPSVSIRTRSPGDIGVVDEER